MKRGELWIMGWKVWTIPVGLGVISTLVDLTYSPGQLRSDWVCWIVTAVAILIAVGALKGVLPINTGNPILGAWLTFAIATVFWIGRLFFHIPLHFHV